MPDLNKPTFMYLFLAIAVVAEVIATMALKSSLGFTKLIPSLIVVVGYGISFYFFALVIQIMPIGIAYSLWAGLGIFLVTLVGAFKFQQIPDIPAMIGMLLIVCGVIVINLFSNTVNS